MKDICGNGSTAFEAIAAMPALLIGAPVTRSVIRSIFHWPEVTIEAVDT